MATVSRVGRINLNININSDNVYDILRATNIWDSSFAINKILRISKTVKPINDKEVETITYNT